ncbi:hypothetical protein EJ07DRAFT_180344 [Lizonia empirigonia]|nr:hypothetical protein EJ07DRAFT_180344 [Lizonia empirigonia]
MRYLTVVYMLAAILHTASAFSFSPAFPVYGRLPDCAQECKVLLDAEDNCTPPRAPVTNNATYLDCFCQSEELRGLRDSGKLCRSQCDKDATQFIQFSYDSICDTPRTSVTPSPTSSPTSSLTPTSSTQATSTISTPVVKPTSSSDSMAGDFPVPQTWAQKHWRHVLAGVLVPVILLLLAIAVFYFRRRYLQRRRESQRELTEEERIEAMLPALQEALEENYGPQARGRIIPLQTMNSDKSFRGRLSRMALYDPIINRRQRQRNASISTIFPLTRLSPLSAPSTQTLQRPDSVRTTYTANSVG